MLPLPQLAPCFGSIPCHRLLLSGRWLRQGAPQCWIWGYEGAGGSAQPHLQGLLQRWAAGCWGPRGVGDLLAPTTLKPHLWLCHLQEHTSLPHTCPHTCCSPSLPGVIPDPAGNVPGGRPGLSDGCEHRGSVSSSSFLQGQVSTSAGSCRPGTDAACRGKLSLVSLGTGAQGWDCRSQFPRHLQGWCLPSFPVIPGATPRSVVP